MATVMNDPSLPWGKIEINSTSPLMNKSSQEIIDRIMGSTRNNASASNAISFANKTVEGILGILSRVLGYDTSSQEQPLEAQTFGLIPRHNITKLQAPHPPHPFTVSVSGWWHMHKAALVATVLGLVCVVAMLAAAGVWFCCVKPRRKRIALECERKLEEGNVESDRAFNRGLEQNDGQLQDVHIEGVTDGSIGKEV